MLTGSRYIPSQFLEFLRYSSITGFIVVATLFINLNHKAFTYLLRDSARKLWWVFVLFAVIPLLLFLWAFTFIFGKFFF